MADILNKNMDANAAEMNALKAEPNVLIAWLDGVTTADGGDGLAAAHRPRLYSVLRPVLDLMQTFSTFVYLILAIVFFGIGMVPGLIATIIFVMPAPIRLTQLGIS